MKYTITCIRDSATEAHSAPMYAASIGQAIRTFTDEVQRPNEQNMLHKHPEDFELYYLGTYDDQDCTFECNQSPRLLIRGLDCKKL